MKKVEIILGGLTIIFMVSRLLFIYPFSALLITFSCLFLSILYLVFGFALLNNIRFRNIFNQASYKGISILRILLTIVTGFVLSTLVIYILFKFQQWPYGAIGLQITLIGLAFIICVVIIKYLVSKSKFYLNFLIRLFSIGVVGIVLLFISNERMLEMKYRDFPEYVKAEKALMKDPQNMYLMKSADEERKKMDLANDKNLRD